MPSIETIEKAGQVFEIYYDLDPINPRRDEYKLATLAIRHIGDEEPEPHPDLTDCIWLPVYRYEHGNTLLSTQPFSDIWDSALTGYIYVTRDRVRREYGVRRITSKIQQRVFALLRAEVEEYSRYLSGEVYGYICKDAESGEEIEACWGVIGREHILQEIHSHG
jgi:hypothetical protein